MLRLGERGRLSDVVDHQRGLGVAVVHWREAGEPLLARRVPDLELDGAGREVAFLGQEGGCAADYTRVSATKLSSKLREGTGGGGGAGNVAHLLLSAPCFLGSRCSRTASRERTRRPDCQYAASTSAVCELRELTFPTAASPSSTSLTLLLGLGADVAPESAMMANEDETVECIKGGVLSCRLRGKRVGEA